MIHYYVPNRINSHYSMVDEEGEEGETEAHAYSMHSSYEDFSRPSLLLLDYKQFCAARRIQALWRGYRYRMVRNRCLKAAVNIQRWWRGFMVRNHLKDSIESRLQQALLDHYDGNSVRIQAQFRGWHIRQSVHDVYSLQRSHIGAAEELLSCVAYKLHHLLRTQHIPGVYSLRNTQCLSAVEKLLNSMTFRFHNDRVRYQRLRMASFKHARIEQFHQNKYKTEVPFAGPNYNTVCKPQCDEHLVGFKDMETRMYKIIEEYERNQANQHLNKFKDNLAQRKLRKHIEDVLAMKEKHKTDFCGDVIASMQKWKIWDEDNLVVSNRISPENLHSFLKEAATILDKLTNTTCYCRLAVHHKLGCPE